MLYISERRFFFDNIFTNPKLIYFINSLIMCSLSTTQMALAFHPDSKVKTQEAYNCVANFLDSLEEQEIKKEIVSKSKNAKQKSKKNTMVNLAIQVLTKKNDLHYKTVWNEIEKLGYKPPRGGKTPENTLRVGMSNSEKFIAIGGGKYRLIS